MKSEILLVAAISRLLDLHDSRREKGSPAKVIVPPRPDAKNAGYHLSIGLTIIDAFEELEQDSFHPKSRIVDTLQSLMPSAEEVDIDYCLRMLSSSREIHFISDDQGQNTFTKDTTPLLDRGIGEYDQYRLSDNARLLARVTAHESSWMYEDKDTEKIIRAIENNQFQDVPRFCRERINSLLTVGKEITRMEERSSTEEAISDFVNSHDNRMDVLRRSLDIIKRAMTLIRSDIILIERFEEWQQRTGRVDVSLGNILSDIEAVAQMIEKISRRISDFLVNVRENRQAAVGVTNFLEKTELLVKTPPSTQTFDSFLVSIVSYGLSSSFFSPLDFIESVDLVINEKVSIAKEMSLSGMVETVNERLSQFLERNRGWVIGRLRKGPVSFQELLATGEFIIEPGESIADFYGVYAVPDEFGRDLHISIGIGAGKLNFRSDGVCMHGDDPILFLEEGQK